MRGLDGATFKMQGELLARMQVAHQAEAAFQQARAQAEAQEALRRLREEVPGVPAGDTGERLREVQAENLSPRRERGRRERRKDGTGTVPEPETPPPDPGDIRGKRVDLRA